MGEPAAMVGLMIKKMGVNMRPLLRERLARCRLVLLQAIQHGFVGSRRRTRIMRSSSSGGKASAKAMNCHGVRPSDGPLHPEPLKPYTIGHQEMIECSIHALEECTDITAIVGVTERKRRLVEPSVGPTVVGCELFEVSFHDTARLHEDATIVSLRARATA